MTDVSNGAPSNILGLKDVYEAILRVEAKNDQRFNALESKVDLVSSRQDRLDGALSLVKWLGPAGVMGLIYGIGKAAGYW